MKDELDSRDQFAYDKQSASTVSRELVETSSNDLNSLSVMNVWTVLIVLVIVLETAISETMSITEFDKVPLSKSLGFSIRENFGKTLQAKRVGNEYLELYNEMVKSNQDSTGLEDDESDIGSDLTRLKRIADRRRHARMQSSVGRRRARSQALRRQKLNSQSLRSHREHSRHTSLENKL